MITPQRPQGTTKFHSWAQQVHDRAFGSTRANESSGANVSRTTKGFFSPIPKTQAQVSNPFQIYQSTSWLKYKVTTGKVIATGDPITPTNVEAEITITSGVARYWFYLEMTSTTAEVKTSATTLTWSNTLIPIGWVDTSVTNVGTINQFLRDHVFNPCAT